PALGLRDREEGVGPGRDGDVPDLEVMARGEVSRAVRAGPPDLSPRYECAEDLAAPSERLSVVDLDRRARDHPFEGGAPGEFAHRPPRGVLRGEGARDRGDVDPLLPGDEGIGRA